MPRLMCFLDSDPQLHVSPACPVVCARGGIHNFSGHILASPLRARGRFDTASCFLDARPQLEATRMVAAGFLPKLSPHQLDTHEPYPLNNRAVRSGFTDEDAEEVHTVEARIEVAQESAEKAQLKVEEATESAQSAEEAESIVLFINVVGTALMLGVAYSSYRVYSRWMAHRRTLRSCWEVARASDQERQSSATQ